MSESKFHVQPISLDATNNDGMSIKSKSLCLSDNQRHWLVAGIAINVVLVPSLRGYVNNKMKIFYSDLNKKFRIEIQANRGNVIRNDPKNEWARFDYGSLLYNQGRRNENSWNYDVENHIELARLYMKPYMAKFKAIDHESFDGSALLNIIERASCFDETVPEAAKVVRNIRNDWGHFDESKWTRDRFLKSFDSFQALAKALNCDDIVSENLQHWKENGVKLLYGTNIDKDVLKEIVENIQMMMTDSQIDVESLKMLEKANLDLGSRLEILEDDVAQVKHLVLSSQSRLALLEDKTSFITQNSEKRKGRKDIPNKNPNFTGRLDALEAIRTWINVGDCRVFTICGLGGMGKTSLVIESNWRWPERFPAGIFWLTADDNSSEHETNIEASLKTFCLKLNLRNEDMSSVDAVTTYLGDLEEDFLLVVDNLDQDEFSTMTNKLINGRWLQNKHARLMLTTRIAAEVISDRMTVPLTTLTLTNFSSAEGSLFLERKTGISPQDQVSISLTFYK